MRRISQEILKLKNMPAAEGLRQSMTDVMDKLETLRIEEQDLVDALTVFQLQYKAYLYGELKSEEAVLLKQLCLKRGEDCNKFPYTVEEDK